MKNGDFGIASIDDGSWMKSELGARHISLTERLGCKDTTVEAYHINPNEDISLPTSPEILGIPLDVSSQVTVDATYSVSQYGIMYVPAGMTSKVTNDAENTWLVVTTETNSTPEVVPKVITADDVEFVEAESENKSSAPKISRLTARLNSQGMKVNFWRLEPGENISYHQEGTQEELYIPLDGSGTMRIDGSEYRLEPGSVARISPEISRSPVNDDDETRLWLMIGAPPTGGPYEWDPGAKIVEWPGSNE